MKLALTTHSLLIALALCGCQNSGGDRAQVQSLDSPSALDVEHEDDDDADEQDEQIPLSQVPQHIKDAALAAVPGLVLEDAEKEYEDGVLIYCIEGHVGGHEYEVEVMADGSIGEIELDEQDDDDEDDQEEE